MNQSRKIRNAPMLLAAGLFSVLLSSSLTAVAVELGEGGKPIEPAGATSSSEMPAVEETSSDSLPEGALPEDVLPAAPTTVYKKVGKDGSVIFTDKADEGGEVVNVLPANSMPAQKLPEAPSAEGGGAEGSGESADGTYKKCMVMSPQHDTVVRRGEVSTVSVKGMTEPELFPGHKVQFYLNGKPLGQASVGLGAQITELYRGAYTITFKVLDVEGKGVCASKAVTFHVKQHSKLIPEDAKDNPDVKPPKPDNTLPGDLPPPSPPPVGKPGKGGAASSGGAGSTGGAASTGGAGSTGGAASTGGAGSVGGAGATPPKTKTAPK